MRREIARLEARLVEARRQQTGLRGEVAALDVELALQERRLAEARAARDVAAGRAAAHEREVARLEASLGRRPPGPPAAPGRALPAGAPWLPPPGALHAARRARCCRRSAPCATWRAATGRRSTAGPRRAASLADERERLAAEREERERWIRREAARRGRAGARAAAPGRPAGPARAGGAGARRARRRAGDARAASSPTSSTSSTAATPPRSPAGRCHEFRGVLDWPARGPGDHRLRPAARSALPDQGAAQRGGDSPPGRRPRCGPSSPARCSSPRRSRATARPSSCTIPGRVFTLYAGLSELRVGPQDMRIVGRRRGLGLRQALLRDPRREPARGSFELVTVGPHYEPQSHPLPAPLSAPSSCRSSPARSCAAARASRGPRRGLRCTSTCRCSPRCSAWCARPTSTRPTWTR